MPLLVVCNPVSGVGDGYAFARDHALPLFHNAGKPIDALVITERLGHAGEAVVEFLKVNSAAEKVNVVLSSGDGTLHEIVNAVYTSTKGNFDGLPRIHIALIPSGTANALYSSLYATEAFADGNVDTAYRLLAVDHLVQDHGELTPLTLTKTVVRSASEVIQEIISVVVTSVALHASILHDSEALRQKVPDLRRFKMAAADNIERWYNGRAKLIPMVQRGKVLRFLRDKQEFVSEKSDVLLEGPFAYFLSTVNVDRLEPQFRITPLQSHLPPGTSTAMDVILIRPRRADGANDDEKEHANVAKVTSGVLSAAYQNGAHMITRNEAEDEINPMVEYFRCGGWQWIPDPSDEHAHLLCCDGAVSRIPVGGEATCTALGPEQGRFFMHAASSL